MQERDVHLSNWYTFKELPQNIFRHFVSRRNTGKIEFDTNSFHNPAAQDSALSFVSFADSDEIKEQLPAITTFIRQKKFHHQKQCSIHYKLPRQLSYIFRKETMLASRGLVGHEMSNRSKSFYFKRGQLKDDRLYFTNLQKEKRYREVVGYSTRNERLRYWHYAVSGKPDFHPIPHLAIKGHVLFSNDGTKIWESKDKLAKARRSQCKSW